MAFNVFISYSTKDIGIAHRLQNYLTQIQDTSIFLSESSLIVGQLSDTLVMKIKECDLFIVLYSKNSQNSNYVQQEIGVARGNIKIIIPILLDSEAKPDAMILDTSYLTLYDEEKRNAQMPKLYNYIAQESKKKNNIQTLLALSAIILLGYVIYKDK